MSSNPFIQNDNPYKILYDEIQDNKLLLKNLIERLDAVLETKKETYLSPQETRKIFNPPISKSTLIRWTNKGILRRHIIGGRVSYKLSEVQNAASKTKLYKANCPVETGQSIQ